HGRRAAARRLYGAVEHDQRGGDAGGRGVRVHRPVVCWCGGAGGVRGDVPGGDVDGLGVGGGAGQSTGSGREYEATRMMSLDATPQQRRILVWMCVFIGVNQLGFGALIPVLPLYAQAFGVTASAIGITISVYGLARMFSAMPAGQLSDTLGRRPSLAIGGGLCAAGNLWCALATSFPEFV